MREPQIVYVILVGEPRVSYNPMPMVLPWKKRLKNEDLTPPLNTLQGRTLAVMSNRIAADKIRHIYAQREEYKGYRVSIRQHTLDTENSWWIAQAKEKLGM